MEEKIISFDEIKKETEDKNSCIDEAKKEEFLDIYGHQIEMIINDLDAAIPDARKVSIRELLYIIANKICIEALGMPKDIIDKPLGEWTVNDVEPILQIFDKASEFDKTLPPIRKIVESLINGTDESDDDD